jgi:hypothetical protein
VARHRPVCLDHRGDHDRLAVVDGVECGPDELVSVHDTFTGSARIASRYVTGTDVNSADHRNSAGHD